MKAQKVRDQKTKKYADLRSKSPNLIQLNPLTNQKLQDCSRRMKTESSMEREIDYHLSANHISLSDPQDHSSIDQQNFTKYTEKSPIRIGLNLSKPLSTEGKPRADGDQRLTLPSGTGNQFFYDQNDILNTRK